MASKFRFTSWGRSGLVSHYKSDIDQYQYFDLGATGNPAATILPTVIFGGNTPATLSVLVKEFFIEELIGYVSTQNL